jgi:hypothetical protein
MEDPRRVGFQEISGQIHDYLIVLDTDGVATHLLPLDQWRLAGGETKRPSVPGTDDLVALDISLTERSAGMRAIPIEGIESPTNAKQGDFPVLDLELAAGSIRNLGNGANGDRA